MSTIDRANRSITPKYVILKNESRIFHTEHGEFIGYRIRALRDFNNPGYGSVKKGTWGGFVCSNDNLSHEGNCWISSDAAVLGRSMVSENAWIMGNAVVRGSVFIHGHVLITDNAVIVGISDDAGIVITGETQIEGMTKVTAGGLQISGYSFLTDQTEIRVEDSNYVTFFKDIRLSSSALIRKPTDYIELTFNTEQFCKIAAFMTKSGDIRFRFLTKDLCMPFSSSFTEEQLRPRVDWNKIKRIVKFLKKQLLTD